MGFMIWTVVGRDRWARRVGFGGPSGRAPLPVLIKSIVQYSMELVLSFQLRPARLISVTVTLQKTM